MNKTNQVQANIHPGAKIADGVIIEPFATIYENVEIGEGSWIGPNAVIMDGARLGKNCKVFPGAVISAIPQDLKYQGEETTAEIGDNTIIRECVTINKGTRAKGKTTVGNNSLVMAYVHIAHDCRVGDNVILVNNAALAGEVEIDDFAIVSAASLIHQFCRIGKHTMLQGGSRVGKDVPPYITAGRIPLAYEGLNSIGLKRRGFPTRKINEIQEIYRVIYHGGYNNSQAMEYIKNNFPVSDERDEILEFMKASKRGIIRGLNSDEQ
ncbi:MAG: acyl-ACP--UDP-N-acetylglucosamine O-acyltransferase [Bacteroidales bacterium]|nr:acyl-ACP--UDP-N-acetylglucosamine O-acyltransferase [Bacteroidales bacterium]